LVIGPRRVVRKRRGAPMRGRQRTSANPPFGKSREKFIANYTRIL
jgi:hypothetical protein